MYLTRNNIAITLGCIMFFNLNSLRIKIYCKQLQVQFRGESTLIEF